MFVNLFMLVCIISKKLSKKKLLNPLFIQTLRYEFDKLFYNAIGDNQKSISKYIPPPGGIHSNFPL